VRGSEVFAGAATVLLVARSPGVNPWVDARINPRFNPWADDGNS
jgi:hypothetical protein